MIVSDKKLFSTEYINDKLKYFHLTLAVMVILWMNTGFFAYVNLYLPPVVIVGMYFLWFFIATFDKYYLSLVVNQMTFLYLFYGLILFFYFFDFTIPENYYLLNIFYLIMIYSIFLFYYDVKNLIFIKIFVLILTVDYILIYIKTSILLTRFPDLSRILAMGMDYERLGPTLTFGVGNYSYFYGLVAIILFSIFMLIKSCRYRFIIFIITILLFKLLVDASFTTSILLCLLFIFILIIRLYLPQYFWIALISFSLIFFISLPFIADIFEALSKTEWFSPDITGRLIEMSDIFSKGEINPNSDSGARFECYAISLNTIQNNFILNTFSNEPLDRLYGGHSAWLDTLALYNFGGLFLFIFLIGAFNYLYQNVCPQFKIFVSIFWTYFIVLGLINTLLFSPIFVVWFLYLPFLLLLISQNPLILSECKK